MADTVLWNNGTENYKVHGAQLIPISNITALAPQSLAFFCIGKKLMYWRHLLFILLHDAIPHNKLLKVTRNLEMIGDNDLNESSAHSKR